MAKIDEIKRHAEKMTRRISGVGLKKRECKEKGLVPSISTLETYAYIIFKYLWWRHMQGLPICQQDKKVDMHRFLKECAEVSMQATINKYISAMTLVYKIKVGHIEAKIPTAKYSRSYLLCEVLKIVESLPTPQAIAILIVYFSGLRAHELLEIRRRDEDGPTKSRNWLESRFDGMENFTVYVVTGKGGLKREIAIPNYLVTMLESFRREEIFVETDRKIQYDSLYDLPGGAKLSGIFSRASKKVLGWSLGLHGLRHSYAKARFNMLRTLGHKLEVALKIVSEELGHFRLRIVFEYLR